MKSIIVVAALVAAAFAQPLADPDGILSFVRAAEDYAFQHLRIERRMPALEVNANAETIRRAIDAMAAAVRAARPDATQGDFFNPAAQAAIRTRLARALRTHALTPADVLAAELADGVDSRGVVLKVHDTFPWALSTAMTPCLLEALPPLPPELQYRLVGRDLILIDVHASLVIDILPRALGAGDSY
jgi:hypothetical protein